MKGTAVRLVTLGIILTVAVSPVFAQDAPDPSTTDQTQTQGVDQGQPDQGPGQDQGAAPTDDSSTPAPSPTSAPTSADPAAVIAQWGPAPSIGPDADKAVAQRWFREQNAMRSRWGVPTATLDPYLDWQAENFLRTQLGQPPLAQPQGLTRPAASAQSSRSDQAVLSEPEFWSVSDDLWQAWLDTFEAQPPEGWADERPGEPWFTPENYLQLFKVQRTPRFDRYRLVGVAGRVNPGNSPPVALLTGEMAALERIAPGSGAAYEPLMYPDNLVAVVAYDPWINPDGSVR